MSANRHQFLLINLLSIFIPIILVGCGNSEEEASPKQSQTTKPINTLFQDQALQNCVNTLALQPSNNWSTADDINGTLDCSNKNILNLAGIENLTTVKSLILNGNSINDVALLASLTQLEVLRLQNNAMGVNSNVDALVTLTNATDLNFAGNPNISCADLTKLANALNTTSNQSEVVNPEPFSSVNCS